MRRRESGEPKQGEKVKKRLFQRRDNMCDGLEDSEENTAVSRINMAGAQRVKERVGRIQARGVHDSCLLMWKGSIWIGDRLGKYYFRD